MGVSYDQLIDEENTGMRFVDTSAWFEGIIQKWTDAILSSHLGDPWKTVVKGNPVGITSSSEPGCPLHLEEEVARPVIIY